MSLAITVAVLLWLQDPAPAPKPAETPQAEEYKDLRDNNIFSPHKPKRDVPVKPANTTSKEPDKAPAPKPDLVQLTGLILGAEGRFEALIEHKKNKEVRWCKPGDTVEGWTIVSVTQHELVARMGTEEKKLAAGDALVGEVPKPPPDPKVVLGEAETDPKKIEEAQKRMRERMKDKKTAPDAEVVEDAPVKKRPKP